MSILTQIALHAADPFGIRVTLDAYKFLDALPSISAIDLQAWAKEKHGKEVTIQQCNNLIQLWKIKRNIK